MNPRRPNPEAKSHTPAGSGTTPITFGFVGVIVPLKMISIVEGEFGAVPPMVTCIPVRDNVPSNNEIVPTPPFVVVGYPEFRLNKPGSPTQEGGRLPFGPVSGAIGRN